MKKIVNSHAFAFGLLVILILSVPTELQASEFGVFKQIGIQTGLQQYQFKDQTLNPTRYENKFFTSPTLEIFYQNTTPTSILYADFGVDLAYGLSNRFDNGEENPWAMHPRFRVTYEKKHKEFSSYQINWYLGGDLVGGFHFAEIPLWDDTHYYWLTYYSFSIRNTFSLDFKQGGNLKFEFAIPLVALVSRPPEHYENLGDDTGGPKLVHQHMKLTSLHQYQNLDLSLHYTMPLRGSLDMSFGYAMNFFHSEISKSNGVSILQHSTTISLTYRL